MWIKTHTNTRTNTRTQTHAGAPFCSLSHAYTHMHTQTNTHKHLRTLIFTRTPPTPLTLPPTHTYTPAAHREAGSVICECHNRKRLVFWPAPAASPSWSPKAHVPSAQSVDVVPRRCCRAVRSSLLPAPRDIAAQRMVYVFAVTAWREWLHSLAGGVGEVCAFGPCLLPCALPSTREREGGRERGEERGEEREAIYTRYRFC